MAKAIHREIQAFDPDQRSWNTGAMIHGPDPSVVPYIAVVFFSQARCRCRSILISISTFSASVAVNRQSSGRTPPQTPHNLWRRL